MIVRKTKSSNVNPIQDDDRNIKHERKAPKSQLAIQIDNNDKAYSNSRKTFSS